MTDNEDRKKQIEFWEDLMMSIEKLDCHSLITKNEKHKIHTRLAKTLKKHQLCACHEGFRTWKIYDERTKGYHEAYIPPDFTGKIEPIKPKNEKNK